MGKLEELIFTLEICKKFLPDNAHPTHYERLDEIERIVRKELYVPGKKQDETK